MSTNQNIVELQRDRDRTEPLTPELEQAAGRIRYQINRTAYDIGLDLQAAKAQCTHGQWLPFLDAAEVPERAAQRLMKYCRAIEADTSIEPGKSLPSMRSVLGSNTSRVSYLVNDATDEKLEEEAEQRETGWKKQADNPPEPLPREPATDPEPVPLEGDVIRPSTSKQIVVAQRIRIVELEGLLERAEERIAIMLMDDADLLKTYEGLEVQINTLRSQLANYMEENRRHKAHIKHLKAEVKK